MINSKENFNLQFVQACQIQIYKMQAIKSVFLKVKDFFVTIGEWISNKYRNNRKKCRGILIALATLSLLAGLIAGSYKSVNSISQGVPINYSSGTIIDSTKANYGSFVGLNTYYYTVPANNFLITFNSDELSEKAINTFPSIIGRAEQGIKVEIDVDAKVKLVPSNLKTFLQNYGMGLVDGVHSGWQIYIKEKIRNVIVQVVSGFKFYQITNQALASAINNQFTSYQTNTQLNYPFIISIIGINVRYPKNTMEMNDTLGIKLLKETSRLSQLTNKLATLQSYISTYQSQIEIYSSQKAKIDGTIVSHQEAVKIQNTEWLQGLHVLNSSLQNSTLLQKYLEVYFNRLYNITYRVNDLTPFII